ncbi:MAG: hypothetical protein LUG59_09485 [Enterocloster clostridioformis]|nr:hypothetical protein [Enterocloster clostridioformis]
MNDIFNEVFGGTDTSKLTPIEIALGIDGEGRTTATKLYDFLELNPATIPSGSVRIFLKMSLRKKQWIISHSYSGTSR